MDPPLVEKKDCNYENFIDVCPRCGYRNIYNRRTDLKTFDPIGGLDVECFNCHKNFWITGDEVNAPYRYLYYDCRFFEKEKRYMYCIIGFCQAIEMFLSYAIEWKLVWVPHQNGIIERTDLDAILKDIRAKFEECGFSRLRNIFFYIHLNRKSFCSKPDILNYTNRFSDYWGRIPSDAEVQACPGPKLATLFLNLKTTQVNELRNDVVHQGYRTSLKEVYDCQEETAKIVLDLATGLGIESNP